MSKPNPIMQFFKYKHLPTSELRLVSKGYCDMAEELHETLPPSAETSVALRKLLESKDAAVRATLTK